MQQRHGVATVAARAVETGCHRFECLHAIPGCSELGNELDRHERLADIRSRRRDEDRRHATSSGRTAAASAATCSAVCAAENVTRSREVPGGTVGGRIAATRKPALRSAVLAAKARDASPMTKDTIALDAGGSPSAAVNSRARVDGSADEGLVRRNEVESAARRGDGSRRQARRVDEAARAIAYQLCHAVARAEITSVAADGFRQRAHLQRHGDRVCRPRQSSSLGRRRRRRGRARRRSSATRRARRRGARGPRAAPSRLPC